MSAIDDATEEFMQEFCERNPHEQEFCQAVHDVDSANIASLLEVADPLVAYGVV